MSKFCETKVKILNTAEKLFAENGFSATPISKIAEECSITKSLVFYHFNRKKDLLKNIIKLHFEEIRKNRDKMIERVVKKLERDKIDDSGKFFIEEMIKIMFDNEHFWKLMFYEIIRDEEVWNYFKNFIKMWHDEVFTKLSEKGIVIKNKKQFIFTRMFNVIGPIMLYTIKKDEWNKYLDTNEKEVKNNFIKNFVKIIDGSNIRREKE